MAWPNLHGMAASRTFPSLPVLLPDPQQGLSIFVQLWHSILCSQFNSCDMMVFHNAFRNSCENTATLYHPTKQFGHDVSRVFEGTNLRTMAAFLSVNIFSAIHM